MPRELLPPNGVFVPTWLVYKPDISPAAFRTWVQLRGLAWGRDETPSLSLRQVSLILEKSESTLYSHMAILRSWGVLRFRPSENGTLIVEFDAEGGERNRPIPDSRNPEKPTPLLKDLNQEYLMDEGGIYSTQPGKPVSGPESVYRTLTGVRPNQAQRMLMRANVTDTDLWYCALEHWLAHKWNPTNLPGILDFYKRGGAQACIACRRDLPANQSDLLDQVRKEIEDGSSPADSSRA